MWIVKHRQRLSGLAMVLLGMIFVFAAIGKLILGSGAFDLLAFPSFIPQSLAEAIYISLPYIELTVGCLLLLGIAVKFVVSLSGLLIVGFAASNIFLISQGISECANCFGDAVALTPTASLFLDGGMAALVIVLIFCYRGRFFNMIPWFLESEGEYV